MEDDDYILMSQIRLAHPWWSGVLEDDGVVALLRRDGKMRLVCRPDRPLAIRARFGMRFPVPLTRFGPALSQDALPQFLVIGLSWPAWRATQSAFQLLVTKHTQVDSRDRLLQGGYLVASGLKSLRDLQHRAPAPGLEPIHQLLLIIDTEASIRLGVVWHSAGDGVCLTLGRDKALPWEVIARVFERHTCTCVCSAAEVSHCALAASVSSVDLPVDPLGNGSEAGVSPAATAPFLEAARFLLALTEAAPDVVAFFVGLSPADRSGLDADPSPLRARFTESCWERVFSRLSVEGTKFLATRMVPVSPGLPYFVHLLAELAAGAAISAIKGPPGSGKTDMAFFCAWC